MSRGISVFAGGLWLPVTWRRNPRGKGGSREPHSAASAGGKRSWELWMKMGGAEEVIREEIWDMI